MKPPWLRFCGALAVAGFAAGAAQAAVQYRWVFADSGDTVGIGGLADNGDLLLRGFGDACPGGKSASRVYNPVAGNYGPRNFFVGLPNGLDAADCGVQVERINSAGDGVGSSLRGGVAVPTFWRAGVAYDLRDPAHSALAFVPDPFAVSAVGVDLSTLDIIAPNSDMRFGTDFYLRARWTNGLGMFAAESSRRFEMGYVLIPTATVPEPGSLALVAAAGAALWLGRRCGA